MEKVSPENLFRHKIITQHRTRMEELRKEWREALAMYQSRYFSRDGTGEHHRATQEGVAVESNYLFAFADTIVANVVPMTPEVTINPLRAGLRRQARFRESLVNTLFRKEKLHSKLWKLATLSVVYPRAFLKAVWRKDLKRPAIRVIPPEYIFFDVLAEEWEDIRYICEVGVMTRGEFTRRVRRKGNTEGIYRADALDDAVFGGFPDWLLDRSRGATSDTDHGVVREGFEWVAVYEYYDLVAKRHLVFLEGCPRPLVEEDLPYSNVPNPYTLLVFNDNLVDLGGLSDADLVRPTLERLNEMSTLQLWHAKTTIPALVVHQGLVDDDSEFEDALESINGPGQIVPMAAKPGVRVSDAIGQTPTPSLPVEFLASKAELKDLIEFVLGMASYQRGDLGQSDVATELALSDTALKTRNARRQKKIYDVIEWLASAVIGLYAEFLDGDVLLPVVEDSESTQPTTYEEVSKALMGLNDYDPLGYEYEARPFDAQEANSVVQLKTLVEFLPVFTQNEAVTPHVDARKLTAKLLDLLKMPELLSEEPAAPPAGGTGAPPVPSLGVSGASPDLGGQGVPPEMQALLQGGEVMHGDGAQMVPGGLAGGRQPGGGTL